MKNKLYIILSFLLIGLIALLAFALWPTKTRSISVNSLDFNDPTLIEDGRYLAIAGDCTSCHTALNGKMFAGGLPLASPIGRMYSSNITPDQKTGIGNYTLDEFDSSVRHGIRADGTTLYPSMPYPSFSLISDDDVIALYAYFMHGVQAVSQENLKNDITWPLSIRWPVAIWRKVFTNTTTASFNAAVYPNEIVARGAYLVQGLGHCGTCHTPRAATLQEKSLTEEDASYLTGGQIIDGWYTTSLRNGADGLGSWSEEDIISTLKTGRNEKYTVIGHGMIDVVRFSTQYMTHSDLAAIAAYLKFLPTDLSSKASYTPQMVNEEMELPMTGLDAQFLYQENCASCHGLQGTGTKNLFPTIAGNSTVLASDPTSLIRLVLQGYDVPQFNPELLPMRMPGFKEILTNKEIAEIITFIRRSWGNEASSIAAVDVEKIRSNLAVHSPIWLYQNPLQGFSQKYKPDHHTVCAE